MLRKLLDKLTKPIGKETAKNKTQRKHLALQTFYGGIEAPSLEKQYATLLKNYPEYTQAVIEKVYLKKFLNFVGLSKHPRTIAGCIFVYSDLSESAELLDKLALEAKNRNAHIMRFELMQDIEALSVTLLNEATIYLIFNKFLVPKERIYHSPV